jgi:predicted SnoaL-like aldol condensation-catalyzing enzyme
MRSSTMALAGAVALAGWTLSSAQQPNVGHSDAPPSTPAGSRIDTSSLKFTPQEQKTIEYVSEYYRALQSHDYDFALTHLTPDEINHNANDPSTGPGLMAMLKFRLPNKEPLHKELEPIPNMIIAKGDMVLLMYLATDKNPKDPSKTYEYGRFEMVRVAGGKIAEHWDVGDRRVGSQTWKIDWCEKEARNDCPKR